MSGRWLYILRCRDGSYYVGTTAKDPEARLSEHQQGLDAAAWTFRRRPVALVHAAFFDSIIDAIAAERRIKGWRREKKEALIRGDYEALPELSRRGVRAAPG